MFGTFVSAVRKAASAACRKLLARAGYAQTPIHEPEAIMEPSQRKPSIFISSTVYDFGDLRGALKYYLEELGYTVNLSEYHDFHHALDENSYEACLKTVRSSDYFVLLIGSRAGGLYTKESNATITQMEYRAAYERAKEGKTRILAFVRKDVWTIKEDRDELKKLLKNELLIAGEVINEEAAAKIAKHSSKFVTDAERIFSFIKEVCKNDEMKEAIDGKAELPIANWIHPFTNFGEIVECLRVQFNIRDSLERKIAVDSLADELLSNLAIMLQRPTSSGKIHRLTSFTEPFRKNYKLSITEPTAAKRKHVLWMLMGAFSIGQPHAPFKFRMIERCLDLGVYLSIDIHTGKTTKKIEHLLLGELRVTIDRFLACKISVDHVTVSKKYLKEAKEKDQDALMRVDGIDFAGTVNVANILDEIFSLSNGLYLHLIGKSVDLENLQRFPRSPFPDQDQMLEEEFISEGEALDYVLNPD